MAKTNNKNFWTAVVLIAFGLALALGGIGAARNIANILITVIGVVLIAYGIVSILSLGLMLVGIIEIVIGVIIIIFSWTILWIALLILGIALVVYGLRGLASNKKTYFLSSLFQLVAGILVLLVSFGNHFAWEFVNILYIIAGTLMIVDGVLILANK